MEETPSPTAARCKERVPTDLIDVVARDPLADDYTREELAVIVWHTPEGMNPVDFAKNQLVRADNNSAYLRDCVECGMGPAVRVPDITPQDDVYKTHYRFECLNCGHHQYPDDPYHKMTW